MNVILDDNKIKASALEISASGKIPEKAVLRNVRVSYVVDNEGNKTDRIDAVRYDCICPDTYASFTLKVNTTQPVVTKESIEKAEMPVFIAIPVDEVVIKPYEISYGVAKVSITAPYVKMIKNWYHLTYLYIKRKNSVKTMW